MSIAPDLDKLMWNIADSGQKDAAESFQKRFPELKHELAKRMMLVQDIKRAKALLPVAPLRPEFRLKARAEGPAFRPSRRLILATALILGAALVFAASYSVFHAKSAAASNKQQTNFASASAISCEPPAVKKVVGPLQRNSHAPLLLSTPLPPEGSEGRKPDEQLVSPTDQVAPLKTDPKSDSKAQRIIMKQVPLSSALHAISAQYGLKIETAPGFPDPTIDLDSEDMDAIAMLKDIGSKYNFGVVEEGDKSVLLVPQGSKGTNVAQ